MLFDWSNQRLFNLYQPIIFRVGMKLTTIVLNMLFLFYKHDLTRTSLNICTENKNFPFWYEQLTYTTEWIFSNSAVLRRKVWDSKRLKEIIRNTLWKKGPKMQLKMPCQRFQDFEFRFRDPRFSRYYSLSLHFDSNSLYC